MQLRNGIQTLDAYRPTFDPHLDIATVVFSHVQCVKTRHSLARVSKLWRDASKPAAAYPLRFDFGAFPDMGEHTRLTRIIAHMDNDEALSLPYERVVGLLGEAAENVCHYAAIPGECKAAEVGAREQPCLECTHVLLRSLNGRLPALQYLHENGCPWDYVHVLAYNTCPPPRIKNYYKHWDCLQYAVDNKCTEWEIYAKLHAKHLR